MIDLEEDERNYLLEMRALTTNANGEEVFAGLTVDESVFYASYIKRARAGDIATPVETDRYILLNHKHETVRRGIISDEARLRIDNPLRH
ncbi:hypothetical protein EIM48_10035 [Pseudoxanthomonas sp. SGNA-20]|uniref:hypothetical protein n=1 Tax=Pseudoxanthomonas sp. SGNA-20 TaxID=2493088 RepID=UPI000F62C47E|nr:hypothetical protein [Pseudoxanthomonas sp. SGNA-20]RRN55987.1 hypothetical protein EIM48_10035 [Pseudoxanthomonas sp. SGNA-20]